MYGVVVVVVVVVCLFGLSAGLLSKFSLCLCSKNETTIRQYLIGNWSDTRKRNIGAMPTPNGTSPKPVKGKNCKKWASCEVRFELDDVVSSRNLPSSTPTASNYGLKLGIDLPLCTHMEIEPTIKCREQRWANALENGGFFTDFDCRQFRRLLEEIPTNTSSQVENATSTLTQWLTGSIHQDKTWSISISWRVTIEAMC